VNCSPRRWLWPSSLAGRSLVSEAEQLLRNRHAIIANLRGDPSRPQNENRRLVIGRTHGGRHLTVVIEATLEPTTWMLVTGWESTAAERRILRHR
jgi:hypothetical protein